MHLLELNPRAYIQHVALKPAEPWGHCLADELMLNIGKHPSPPKSGCRASPRHILTVTSCFPPLPTHFLPPTFSHNATQTSSQGHDRSHGTTRSLEDSKTWARECHVTASSSNVQRSVQRSFNVQPLRQWLQEQQRQTQTATTTTTVLTMTTTAGQGREGDGRGSRVENRQQGSRHNVSSPGMFLFFIIVCFFLLIGLYFHLGVQFTRQGGRWKVRRWKWAQTTRPASFGPLVSPFFLFLCFSLLNSILYSYINMTTRKNTTKPENTPTTPNNNHRQRRQQQQLNGVAKGRRRRRERVWWVFFLLSCFSNLARL